MDVAFNQTEAHMADPAMHHTEVRPDLWRAPDEQPHDAADHASPYSTGAGEAIDRAKDASDSGVVALVAGQVADSADTTTNGYVQSDPNLASVQLSSQVDRLADGQTAQSSSSRVETPSLYTKPPATSTANFDEAPVQPVSTNVHNGQLPPEHVQSAAAPAYSGNVDVQALLDTLAVPSSASAIGTISSDPSQNPIQPPTLGVEDAPLSAPGLGAPANSLPARPPPQEQPLINPNYVHSQHIRDYHPHAANPAVQPQTHSRTGSQGNTADPTARNYVPPVQSPTGAAATTGGQGQSAVFHPNSSSSAAIQTPTNAQGPFSANSTPPVSKRESKIAAGETPNAEDQPWEPQVQAKYNRFIEAERGYVGEGRWDQFPQGSRLFVGNLSSEKVTKRDIFHIFHWYGELAQISIKQAYGFVQFLRTEDCMRALENEQGTWIKDKRIHLEISKPQKSRNQQQNHSRRSRSPDFGRSKPAPGTDRYVSSSRGYGRSYRSPSPRRGYGERYEERGYRARSPDYSRGGRNYRRSPTPKMSDDDDLPLPKRKPHEVPDLQILVLDTLDRDFIAWVEKAFTSRGVRTDVLLLSARLNEQAVVRRQIVEGVQAVVKLNRQNQTTGKIGLQVFDRSSGDGNVKFEEYQDLDPNVCVELVLRAKQKQQYAGYGYIAPPPQQHYGSYGQQPQPPYGQPPSMPAGYVQPAQYGQPTQQQQSPQNLQNLITSLDPNGLQNLLSQMNQGQTPASATPQTTGYGTTPQSVLYPPGPPQPPSGGAQSGVQGGQVNMQDILARLGSYGKQ